MTISGLAGKGARAGMAVAQAAAAVVASLSLGADAGAAVPKMKPRLRFGEEKPLPGLAFEPDAPSVADSRLHVRANVDDRPYPLFGLGGLTVRPIIVGDLLRCLFEPSASERDLGLAPQAAASGDLFAACPASDFADSDRLGGPVLLAAPVEVSRISSGFGMRMHPLLGFTRMHEGVDFAAGEGAPVLAAGDGVVEEARWAGDYGRWLKIRHGSEFETGYAHLSAWAPGIAPGVEVTRGEVVAFVGESGLATGPHLHFEVIKDGRRIDPQSLKRKGRSADARFLS